MPQCILFTGIDISDHSLYRSAGAYRIRTELEDNGYSCMVVDFFQHFSNAEIEDLLSKYVSKETLWIGFSTTFLNTKVDIEQNSNFWKLIKTRYPWIKIIIGGSKSLLEEMDFVDFYVTGYADTAVVEITKNISKYDQRVTDANKEYNKKDLTNIPIKWKQEDLILPGSSLPMEIARGCIFNCAFCNFPMNNKKKLDYIRDPQSIADELKYNYETFGVRDYSFMDDTFNDSIHKLETLHNVISKLDFKIRYSTYIKPELLVAQPDQIPLLIETGLTSAAYGLESLNPETRQSIFKMKDPDRVLEAIKKLKDDSNGAISNQCTMIVGLPHESVKSIYKSFDILYNASYIDHFSYYPLTIHTPDKYAYTSPIDRKPEAFGYVVSPKDNVTYSSAGKTNGAPMKWFNKYMNDIKAAKIAKEFNQKSADRHKIYVWYRESLLNLGFDIESHYTQHNGLLNKLPYTELRQQKEKFIETYKKQLMER
jgi:radical SAM superfamily enzyme YgiQ (UPF0313 family)